MLVAAAVCPPTPLVVLAMPDLRSACHTAIAALRDARPDVLIAVGGAESTRTYDGGAAGSLRPWGVDRTIGGGEPVLPLSLTVARLLMSGDHAPDPHLIAGGDHAPDACRSVAFDASAEECRALGEKLGKSGERVALLVMVDGSACLGSGAPGRHDEEAGPYNEAIGEALAAGDPGVLAALDPARADRLWVGGRAALQVLAGAAGAGRYDGRLLMSCAPYGVGYFAGLWTT
ncbi:hypothetical protein AB0I81_46880 [Nonomuraea sp. NPDC050404]|uniref:hypothetical protein n=1 Tax=Nonomuraea sp. NPDC050404 TaxID=3155783 RepID=UPI0033CBD9FA